MKDIDENGVDRMERFQGYSQRFTQFSVADEVYRETLEYMKHLRNERDAMRKQRDEARRDACAFQGIIKFDQQHPKGMISTRSVLALAKAVATEREWDCFEEGGGA